MQLAGMLHHFKHFGAVFRAANVEICSRILSFCSSQNINLVHYTITQQFSSNITCIYNIVCNIYLYICIYIIKILDTCMTKWNIYIFVCMYIMIWYNHTNNIYKKELKRLLSEQESHIQLTVDEI